LPQADKTAKLAAWVDAPDVGGVLKPLLGGEAEVRVWLKDVALRRRSWGRQPNAEVVARRIFGDVELRVVGAGLKPSHAIVEVSREKQYLAWGPHSNARNLFWAALNASLERGIRRSHVVIVDSPTSTTPADRRVRFEALARRCDVDVHWMTE
jgi:hypothetical protein